MVTLVLPAGIEAAVTELTAQYPLIIAAAIGVAVIPFVARRGWSLLKSFK